MESIEQMIKRLCPEGVEYVKLGEVCKVVNGFAFKSKKYCEKGIRVIRISDVQKGYISDNDLKYYPQEELYIIKKCLLYEDDLVMSLTGNVGRIAQIKTKHLPAGLNQRVACLRPLLEKISRRYLFHFLDRSQFESDAIAAGNGSAQKNLSTKWLENYEIPLPPMEIQARIVEVLDKMTTLEAELEARKQQYEYYRNKLLTFERR